MMQIVESGYSPPFELTHGSNIFEHLLKKIEVKALKKEEAKWFTKLKGKTVEYREVFYDFSQYS